MVADFDSLGCALAHGAVEAAPDGRAVVAVFASPVATHLLHLAATLGYRVALADPTRRPDAATALADPTRRPDAATALADPTRRRGAATFGGVTVDANTDVVVCDHDRPELGEALRDALASPARWIGVMGSPRHTGPHLAALRALGVPEVDIARVRRPIGLNIGSRTPAEIALATLAGLVADRNDRPGGFVF